MKSRKRSKVEKLAQKKLTNRQTRVNKLLTRLYTDVKSGSSALFTSTEPLFREAKKLMSGLTRADVEAFLTSQPVYSRHRRAVRRFKRMATIAPGLHTHWQCDLSDMQRLSEENQGYNFFLLCIDALSRQIFVEPVKRKTAECLIQAFRTVFQRCGYTPWKLVSDQGKEFTAAAVQEFLKSIGVTHYCMYTSPQFHAGMAERANRSVKERLYRYFTHAQTRRWIDVIQPLVDAINHSPCSTLNGMRPIDVTFENASQVRDALKERLIPKRQSVHVFKVDDCVRIERHKHVFQKGYEPNFTRELFRVCVVRNHPLPVTYQLIDSNGEVLKGWFYAQDLSLVHCDGDTGAKQATWAIERVIKKRRRHGADELFVKWKGFDEKYNSWISASSITNK